MLLFHCSSIHVPRSHPRVLDLQRVRRAGQGTTMATTTTLVTGTGVRVRGTATRRRRLRGTGPRLGGLRVRHRVRRAIRRLTRRGLVKMLSTRTGTRRTVLPKFGTARTWALWRRAAAAIILGSAIEALPATAHNPRLVHGRQSRLPCHPRGTPLQPRFLLADRSRPFPQTRRRPRF